MEIEESVIAKIQRRRDAGRKKYGTSMERKDLTIRQWLVHAQEEAMDLAIYLEKLIQETDGIETIVATLEDKGCEVMDLSTVDKVRFGLVQKVLDREKEIMDHAEDNLIDDDEEGSEWGPSRNQGDGD